MKKQFLIGALLAILGICLCTNNQSSLKACVKDAAACPVKIEKEKKFINTGYAADEDDSFYTYMNPVTQL